ncbi:lysylphosphatidylglycerol synthase domain-containing protein [Pseudonocardia sp. 73-21]|jgi:hypothetical protein|uniref:lysylphosphatidylglycerol synthase domain-containing protein n=1 Tax=Pseudonocardia sp. 73-21 TaxID=1895809 RepID=UPI00095FF6E2|nr:lysylphosphatidylglycerol synthase domain-containing protein [Pseudonocardia sp. 73-21]OJY51775.1 MAG: hypothetical protein BGP03_03635 [Pseudonocardia sp. 73-21]
MPRSPHRAGRIALTALVTLAAAGLAVQQVGPDTAGALQLLRGSGVDAVRTVAAAVLSAASLLVYGELHRRLLVVAGADLPGRTVQAVTVAGNAVSLTVPTVGTAAGPAYAVRALCRRGVPTAAAVWSVGAAAVVTSVVLVVLAPLGIAAGGLLPVAAGIGASTLLAVLAVGVAALLRPRGGPHPVGPTRTGTLGGRARDLVARSSVWAAAHRPSPRTTAVLLVLAALTWVLDLACLAACVGATRAPFTAGAVAVGYLAVQASIAIRLTPGGAGLAEAGLLAALVTAGTPAGAAAVAVALYRGVSWLVPAAVGWVVVLLLTARGVPGADSGTRR